MEYGLVALWLVAYALLAVLGYPIAARLFPQFATRGAGLALPIALVVLGLVAYWVGRIAFGPVALLAGLLTLTLLALAAGLDLAALRDGRFVPEVTADREVIMETATVFTIAFGLVIAVRAHDPAVFAAGGEKFLDFGLVRSLLRGSQLPPEDMWFAGQPVRYYYGGHMLTALLAMLTGTAPRFAYNLALAGFYATLVAAVWDLAGSIAAAQGYDRRLGAGFAAFFAGFASNLFTPLREAILAFAPPSLLRALASEVASRTRYETGEVLANTEFSYWTASRVIPGTINEFPLFAWLNGDLHAHMTDTPLLVLAAALAFAYYRTPPDQRRRRQFLIFGAVPLLAGLEAVVNTWGFPTVFGLAWLGVALADPPPWSILPRTARTRIESAVAASPEDGLRADGDTPAVGPPSLRAELARPIVALGLVGGAGVLAVLVAAPFFLGAVGTRSIAIVTPDMRSSLGGLLIVHGGFVLPFLAYLGARAGVRGIERSASVLVALVVLGMVALANDLPVLVIAGPLLAGGWVLLRTEESVGFETVLIVAGVGLVTLVEILFVEELAGPGRFNTVFKVYAQVWVLWALAVGPVLAGLLRSPPTGRTPWPSLPARNTVVSGFVAVLIVSTSVYGGLALSNHFTGQYPTNPTLDATDYVATFHPSQAEGIEWIDAREGQPAILSAPGTGRYPDSDSPGGNPPGMYTFDANPAASLTGVPTVAGWHHEVGYRGPDRYFERVRDVDAAYTSRSATIRVLNEYEVQYIWVGPAERARYDRLTDFEAIPGVSVAHESGDVTIYAVDHDRLPDTREN